MLELSANNIQLGDWIFNEVKLEDMEIYSEYIKLTEYPANLWSSNFAYIWASGQSKRKKILWKIIDDMLVTFVYSRKNTLYLMCMPFGRGNPDKVVNVLLKCLRFCCEWNNNDISKSIVRTINSMQLDFLSDSSEFDKCFKVVNLVGIEKHYSIKKLIFLKGNEFRRIRQRINKFHRYYPEAIIRKYNQDDYDEVIELGKYWSETAGKKYSTIFDKVYFPAIVKHYNELKHRIIVIEIDNKIVGMISGSELPNGQAWGCLSKFMNEFEGLSELMVVEFAHEIYRTNPNIEYMNTGSDLGSIGLRNAKDKFRPVLNLKRYEIYLRND